MSRLNLLWRGPLESCNYACPYCPFAKAQMSREELARDAAALERFVAWVGTRTEPLGIFFTPWGEALVHKHYQRAFVALTALAHIERVAVQTNLSCRLDFLHDVDVRKVGLWSTFHPGETSLDAFVGRASTAYETGVRLSCGVVGFPDHLDAIEALRAALPAEVYLWVNAVKRLPEGYTDAQVARIEAIDPLFRANLRPHASLGRDCNAGDTAFTVDGDGWVRRCHFLPDVVLGNLYETELTELLGPRPCTARECRCHIGYVHMPHLGLTDVFGDGILERIPRDWPHTRRWSEDVDAHRADDAPHVGTHQEGDEVARGRQVLDL